MTIPTSPSLSSTTSTTTTTTTTTLQAYIPSGLSADQYKQIKKQDAAKTKGKDLGRVGPRGFQSRSMQAWQEAYEKGLVDHAFAPIGSFRQKLRDGTMRPQDVPYTLRPGGKWDNSDVAGAPRRRWLPTDRKYARGGYKKQQSVSILGSGPGFDWAGTRSRDENLRNNVVPGLS